VLLGLTAGRKAGKLAGPQTKICSAKFLKLYGRVKGTMPYHTLKLVFQVKPTLRWALDVSKFKMPFLH